MNKEIYDIFDNIYAEDELKQQTVDALYNKILNNKANRIMKLKSALATLIFVFVVGGFSYNFYFTPYSYIDIDVNPSVELIVNRFNYVIKITSYNDDGNNLAKGLKINHKHYINAVEVLIDNMMVKGYLNQNELLSLTVQARNNDSENEIFQRLITNVKANLNSYDTNITTDIIVVSKDVKQYALNNNISPAKYLAITKLQQVNPAINIKYYAQYSISEINQLTLEYGQNNYNENLINENILEENILNEDITNENTTYEDTANEDTANEDTTNEDTTNKDIINEIDEENNNETDKYIDENVYEELDNMDELLNNYGNVNSHQHGGCHH